MQIETDAVSCQPSGAPTSNDGEKTEARPPTGGAHWPKSSEGSGSGSTANRELILCSLCSARVRADRLSTHRRKVHHTSRRKRLSSRQKRQTAGKVSGRMKKKKGRWLRLTEKQKQRLFERSFLQGGLCSGR